MSYITGQIAHDLRIMHKFYIEYMPSWSELLNKLPNIHALIAELKVARPGSPEATIVEKKIKSILEEMAGQVLRAKLDQC